MLKRIPLALLAAGILAGCSMAPTYERPDAPVESQYPTGSSETPSAANRIGWQEFFRDQRLKALIAAAIENNRDLRIAALRIEEARAMYDIQWADRLPTIEVEGTSTRTRTLSNAGPGMVTGGTHQVGVGMPAFELDFFGRVKSLTDAALAKYLATEEAQRSAYISLVSEVAKTYFTERAQAEQIKLASQSYESYLKTLALTKKRYEAGISSAIILRECESLVHAAQVTLANLQREHEKTLNALVVLVGGKMPIGLPEAHKLSEDDLMMDIPEGLPSELLEKRPDIRQHEQLLKAANANIGAARAAFFPRFTLTGFAGTMSTSFSNLFDPHSGAWVFTPQMSVPIFDTGRTIANLDVAEARKNIAVAEYEKTIQVAFREVADALTARKWLDELVKAQQGMLDSETDRHRLAKARFLNGIAGSLEVLDAQRQKFAAEQLLVDARLMRMNNAVELYRALGGGYHMPDSVKLNP